MSLIIPPMECAEEGCTAKDKNAFYCSGCEYEHLPWFEMGVDLASQPDQTAYAEPTPKRYKPMKPAVKRLIKYLLIAAVGVALYIVAAGEAFEQRGYTAYGGELVFLILPLWWKLGEVMAVDIKQTIKQIKTEVTENE